ncbi:Fe2+-dependent dioxygenase [Pseudomonas plecoglossicida]|uniref:Fe2+-dependent dioxygenase n=1 Tax=Pseudomonas plecoglossicida TaxID=70775 RepID=UPI00159F404F|nr:Fe2+-dependent dioxygenase [Pseudomonas plecoglossicida]QLB54135.1 Fe2+-dependent dioxygenase [Pseudomonas plecoglossicida]
MLFHIPGLFDSDELARIRQALEQADWADGKATAGYQSAKAKHNLQLPEGHALAKEIGGALIDRLWQTPRFLSAALPHKVFPPLINCYREGGNFGFHIDNALRQPKGSPERVRTDLSSTLFLSEPDSYAGDLVLYPGTSLHKVNPVTRGVRYAAFFWTQSLVREDSQRALLFEMDNAIQQLTADVPEHPSLLQLTGTYHNLLRCCSRWTMPSSN